MYKYHGKVVRSDPSAREPLMVMNQINASTCNDAAYFSDNDNFANVPESNVNIDISGISSSDTRYGNIQSKRSKNVDSTTLAKR